MGAERIKLRPGRAPGLLVVEKGGPFGQEVPQNQAPGGFLVDGPFNGQSVSWGSTAPGLGGGRVRPGKVVDGSLAWGEEAFAQEGAAGVKEGIFRRALTAKTR